MIKRLERLKNTVNKYMGDIRPDRLTTCQSGRKSVVSRRPSVYSESMKYPCGVSEVVWSCITNFSHFQTSSILHPQFLANSSSVWRRALAWTAGVRFLARTKRFSLLHSV
jgi:hypothetical protein